MSTLCDKEKETNNQEGKVKVLAKDTQIWTVCTKDIHEAKEIDKKNGNTLWMDAFKLELSIVMIAFEEIEDPSTLGDIYQEITGHVVFDIKLGEGFRQKARYCADGHKTKAPSSVTYFTVVSPLFSQIDATCGSS